MPSSPTFGHYQRTKRNTLASRAEDARSIDGCRIPATPPMFCRHRHVFSNCRICTSEWEAMMGYFAIRR
jgi:hypothetical protein